MNINVYELDNITLQQNSRIRTRTFGTLTVSSGPLPAILRIINKLTFLYLRERMIRIVGLDGPNDFTVYSCTSQKEKKSLF